jgi:hypothetical protein
MVTGSTATAYGDFIIASIKTPYLNLKKVLTWEILSGVSDVSTLGTLSFTNGSAVVSGTGTDFTRLFQNSNFIIVGNQVLQIASVTNSTTLVLTLPVNFSGTGFTFYRPVDVNNKFDYTFRLSTDNGKTFSEFSELNNDTSVGDIKSYLWNSGANVLIDFGAEVSALNTGAKLTFIAATLTVETVTGTIESCPQFCTTCTDPFIYSGCATVEATCSDPNALFQPYRQFRSQQTYIQLANIVKNIFGHQVTYFRTEPDMRTKDVILMEYSLHNVVDQDVVKILVPDNEFPQESTTNFDMFGMEFEDFEIHITQQEFQTVFGQGKRPREHDYMFIPIINKMYMINSVSLGDRFNETITYWKVMLTKYQNDTAVLKNSFETLTDSLVTDVDEIFGAEIQDEYIKTTKPDIFQTVSTAYLDGIRNFVSTDLKIVDSEIKNRWTTVSKNYYDLSQVNTSFAAIEYTAPVKSSNGFGLTCWFSPEFNFNSTTDYWLFGNTTINKGLKVTISGQNIKVYINANTYTFTTNVIMGTDRWYGLVINGNKQFNQLSLTLYSLDPNNNTVGLPQSASNDLVKVFEQTRNQVYNISWDIPESRYSLKGGLLKITNVRLFNIPVETEQHSNILNQYVVRDNQLATIIDNAIPSLGFQKFRSHQ